MGPGRCSGRAPAPDGYLSRATMPLSRRAGRCPRAAVVRLRVWVQERYWTPAQEELVRCSRCERLLPPALAPNEGWRYAPQLRYALVTRCAACGTDNRMWLTVLAFGLPEGQRFWRAHPRLRLLPECDVSRDGRPAVLVGFESMIGAARFEVLVVRGPDGLAPLVPR